jgi:2,4-dienoyl-CoA reductase-like NADH-dependent reductase (Old Yellow Enzyme family)
MIINTPFNIGSISLKNRVVLAPMTRARCGVGTNVPNDLMAEYYEQRAGAGLLITEATAVNPVG